MKCIGFRWTTSVALLFACALMICCAATLQAATGPEVAMHQGISPIAQFGQDLGRLPGDTPIELVAILNLQDEDGLRALIAAQNSPDSPSYHQFLTPEEFVQRFSPSPSAYSAVVSYFQESGFAVETTPNRQLVIANGTAAKVEQSFKTELHRFYFQGKVHYANTSAPSVPANLVTSIRAIEGLDSRELVSHMRIAPEAVPSSSSGTPAGYSPDQIAKAYDFPKLHGWNGTGKTMAVASAYDFKDSDLQTFDSTFGITPAGYSRVFVKTSQGGNGTGFETTLDVEYSTALGNGAFELVYLVNRPTFSNFTIEFNQIVADNQADVVTLSWGLCEQQQPSGEITQWDGILMQGVAQGQTWFVATGDSGAFDCGGTTLAVDYPASSPFVTACGGTALNLTSTDSIMSETASSISGGGSSIVESQPSWEFGSAFFTNGKRWTADYSMDADPNTGLAVFQNGKWYVGYGTSFVGPYSAGLAASISQYKSTRLGLFAARLSQLGNSRHLYPIVLHDITSGRNGFYSAGPGWDPPTGWGSPDGYMLMLNF
jgi:kumamolisin